LGAFDVLVGINLLREGLDIPECGLVAILDADKEGFLRSETSLIQTIGRAARNVDGRVILYADSITGSMERAMAETSRRRDKQSEFNAANGITPESIRSSIKDILASPYERDRVSVDAGVAEDARPFLGHNFQTTLRDLEGRMKAAAANLEFEEAARLRDEIKRLKLLDLEFANEVFTPAGEAVDRSAPTRLKARARAYAAERYRNPHPFVALVIALAPHARAPLPPLGEATRGKAPSGRGPPPWPLLPLRGKSREAGKGVTAARGLTTNLTNPTNPALLPTKRA
jgi:excinuclease ABC subunit B